MEHFRTIRKQLKSVDALEENAALIASVFTGRFPDLERLSDEHIQTLTWLNTFLSSDDGMQKDLWLIAEATILGLEHIEQSFNEIAALLHVETKAVYAKAKQKPAVLLAASESIHRTYRYLQSIGLSAAQIGTVFFDALQLTETSLQERCTAALTHWTVEDLVDLVRYGYFSDLPYYDVIEAVHTAVDTLGAANALDFLHDHKLFFVQYRSRHYRTIPSDQHLFQEACKALEAYKKTLQQSHE